VILAAAVMEEYLEKMLESKLVRIPGDEDHLFDGINATKGTFSAKIRVAHRLGLISKTLHDSLDIVRKNRNDFAHNVFEGGKGVKGGKGVRYFFRFFLSLSHSSAYNFSYAKAQADSFRWICLPRAESSQRAVADFPYGKRLSGL
jgi:hypothetical protein